MGIWKKVRASDEDPEGGESKPFIEHLEDLRKTLIQVFIALGVGMAVSVPFAPRVMEFLTRPLKSVTEQPDQFLQSINVTGGVSLFMQVSLWTGLLLAAPIIVYAVGAFVFPGLTRREKHLVKSTSGVAVLLFAVGVGLGYYMLPWALKAMKAFHDLMHIRPDWRINSYIPFVVQLLLAFGLVFEMPIVLLALSKLGVVNSQMLRTKRRHIYLALTVVAAVLTPPDVVSQIVMALPLVALYEICILVIRATERRQKAAEDAAA